MSLAGLPVITGSGVLSAIGDDRVTFAAALLAGRSGIRPAHPGQPLTGPGWPAATAAISGFDLAERLGRLTDLPEAARLRAGQLTARAPFGVRVACVTALEAWEQAKLWERPVPSDRIGLLVAGSNLTGAYMWGLRPKFDRDPAYLPGSAALRFMDTDHVGTLAELLQITGEGFTVGGASASGNVAIVQASRLIEAGAVDACLVLGALTDLSPPELRAFCNLGAAATRPPGAPLSADHCGFVPGQGCAAVVLEATRSAARRGAPPLARLLGYSLRLDANSLANPSQDGEVASMTEAIDRARLTPGDMDYVSAHATGAPLGDDVEAAALDRVFAGLLPGPWVNATKALTGHCLCAAGVIEAVATAIQLAGGFVHPTTGLDHPPDGQCRIVATQAIRSNLRFALSNSFGFGGVSSTIVLARGNG